MGHGNQRPEIELVRAFMPVLVTSNFDDGSIKNEWASMETPFSLYYGKFFRPQGQLSPKSVVRSGRNSNSSEILCMSSLPASIKRIGSKTTEKRWRHHFPHYKSMGAFCCHGNQGFYPICPKTLCRLSPTPMMLQIKFDRLANWLQRYSNSKVWNFRISRASNSKMSLLIRPQIKLDRAFMPVLVISKFDDDSIKNERASMETPFSHYKSMGNFLDAQGLLTP